MTGSSTTHFLLHKRGGYFSIFAKESGAELFVDLKTVKTAIVDFLVSPCAHKMSGFDRNKPAAQAADADPSR